MHVNLRRTAALVLLAVGATVVGGSCANEDTSIFIRGCLLAPHDTCTVTAATTSTQLLQGSIDGAYAGEYKCFALVENDMVAQENTNTLMTETDGVQLYEAEVQVLNSQSEVYVFGGAPSQFSVPISGYVDPAMSGQPGVGISLVTLIDAATMQGIVAQVQSMKVQQLVIASVVIKGRTLGGFEVHTNEFLFPITVGYVDSCSVPSGDTCVGGNNTSATGDCLLGQDEPAGTNCQLIASQLGFCHFLECGPLVIDPTTGMMVSDFANAHCPTHIPPDDTCCTGP
jgi:hypothetical protein